MLLKNISLLLIAATFMGCGTNKKAIQEDSASTKPETMKIWVNSYLGACEKANAVTSVLLTQNNASIDKEAWECNFNTIEGFTFEQGYIYQLEVKPTMKEGMPGLELVQELSKERDPNYFKIYDLWAVTHINGTELAAAAKRPSLEVNLTTMKIMGNGACNNYSGAISSYSTSKIAFGPIASTKMMCGDFKTEREFFEALKTTRRYEVKEMNLIFYNMADKPVAQFRKVD